MAPDTRNGPKSLRFTSHQQQRHLWWVKSLVNQHWDTSHPKTTTKISSPNGKIFRSLVMVVDFLLKNGVLFFWLKNIQESWNSIITGFTVLIHNFLIRILQQPRNGRDWICFGDEAFRRGRVPRLFWQIGVEMVPIGVNVVKFYSNQHRFKVAFYTFLVEMLQDARIHCKLIKDWEDTLTAALHRLSCPYHPREVLQWRCSLGVTWDLEGFNRVFSMYFPSECWHMFLMYVSIFRSRPELLEDFKFLQGFQASNIAGWEVFHGIRYLLTMKAF